MHCKSMQAVSSLFCLVKLCQWVWWGGNSDSAASPDRQVWMCSDRRSKPEAFCSKKKNISGNTMAVKLHQNWKCGWKRSRLYEFLQLFNFTDYVGIPRGLVKASYFSAILKAFTFNYRIRLDLSKKVLFLWDSEANTEWNRKLALWWKDKEKSNCIRKPMSRPLNCKAIACVKFPQHDGASWGLC